MIWILIAIALGCVAISGGKDGLAGFAVFIAAGLLVWSAAGFTLFAPGAAIAFGVGATALFLIIGWLGMLNEWFGKRETQRRNDRVAAGGDYLTTRERKLKTAWDQGRELREAAERRRLPAWVVATAIALPFALLLAAIFNCLMIFVAALAALVLWFSWPGRRRLRFPA